MKFFNKANDKKKLEDTKKKSLTKKAKKSDGVELDLSLRPTEEVRTSKVVRDVYKEEISGLHGIDEGIINIDTSYVVRVDEGYEAMVFIRNATEFDMELNYPCLIVANNNSQILLQQIFDGKDLGKIPPHSARPWKILFDKTYLPESVDLKGLEVSFRKQRPFVEAGESAVGFKSIDGVDDEKAIDIIDYNYKLPILKDGEVNFSMYSLEIIDGFLNFNIIIRNSTKDTFVDPETLKPIVEKLPIGVYKNDKKVFGETLRMGAVVGPNQAKYVHMTTSYKTDSIEGISIKLNDN